MSLARFLRKLFSHWSTGMTGALSLPFALAAVLMPSVPQKALFGTMTLVCLSFAFFKVWQMEAKRVEELEETLQSTRPIVIPEVQRFGEYDKRIRVLLTNVGRVPALNVRVDKVQAIGSIVEFETVQML